MAIGDEEKVVQPEISPSYSKLRKTLEEGKLAINPHRRITHHNEKGIPNLGLIDLVERPYDISKGHINFAMGKDSIAVLGGRSFLGTEAMDIDYPAWEELTVNSAGRVIKELQGRKDLKSYPQFKDGLKKEYTAEESAEIIKKLQKIADNAARLVQYGSLRIIEE